MAERIIEIPVNKYCPLLRQLGDNAESLHINFNLGRDVIAMGPACCAGTDKPRRCPVAERISDAYIDKASGEIEFEVTCVGCPGRPRGFKTEVTIPINPPIEPTQTFE